MLMLKSKPPAVVMLCLIALITGGCGGYFGFWQRQHELKQAFQEEPSADLLRELAPQDCFLLAGRVAFAADAKKPVLAVAVTDRFKKREIVAQKILQPPVFYYQAYLPEGRYELYFFADLDGNGYFDAYEMIGRTAGEPILVSKPEMEDGVSIPGPTFTLDYGHPATADLPVKVKVREQGYAYASLDDEFFDPKYGAMGLYDPKAFIAHCQRYFFSLEEFDPDKTLVVFVHGIQGTPRDFKYLVDGLDKNRYQPWFFFYPSGMPLQKLGFLMSDIVRYFTTTGSFHLQRVIVVAYSMGGLVALSGLNQLCSSGAPPYLKGFVSFNTPYGGVEDAKAAVQNAPVVVPSWRDVATGSPFFEQLYKGPALAATPFYLFFGYRTGDSSDGTVTLQSQLEPKAHFAAFKSYGFNATHEGILNDEAVRRQFYRVLAALDAGEN